MKKQKKDTEMVELLQSKKAVFLVFAAAAWGGGVLMSLDKCSCKA